MLQSWHKKIHSRVQKIASYMPVLLLQTPASHFFQWFFPLATPQRPCFKWQKHAEAHISENRMWNTHTHSSCLLISLKCCCHPSLHATPHSFLSASFIQPPQQQRNGGVMRVMSPHLPILVFLLSPPHPTTFFCVPRLTVMALPSRMKSCPIWDPLYFLSKTPY